MSFHMKNANARRGLQAAAASLFALLASVAHADWGGLNMTEGVTILSKKIYGLHMTIFWWCVAIGIVVFGVMIYSLVKFRKSQGAEADKTLVHSTKVEIIWTVIPILHPGRHGGSHRQDAHRDRGHGQRRRSTSRSRATSGSGNTNTSART